MSLLAAGLHEAATLMNARRFDAACELLTRLRRQHPRDPTLLYLLGAALRMTGDAEGAERELRAVLAIDPRRDDAATDLVRVLIAAARPAEALAATEVAAALRRPREALLVERARALRMLGRDEAVLALRRRTAALYPESHKAQHNLAAALGDAGEPGEAEMWAGRAIGLDGGAAETWLVLARALQAQNRFDEAETAFAAAVTRRPDYAEAVRDHAQLVWMRTGKLSAAMAVVNAASAQAGQADGAAQRRLSLVAAGLLATAGDARAGYHRLTAAIIAGDVAAETAAARLALRWDAALALGHARRAAALAPSDDAVRRTLADALLANGDGAAALSLIDQGLALAPFDQALIAARWTALRLLGDPLAAALYDYAGTVMVQTLGVPAGWPDLETYLAELADALRALHGFESHPFDQSLRHGSQTSVPLLRSVSSPIRAFVAAIDAPVRTYLDWLGPGRDVLRSRRTRSFRVDGLWSVRLRAGGHHVDHVHPAGWISAAFYVAVPSASEPDRRAGWLKFGEPGVPTPHPIPPGHFIAPSPGQLVLFPSFMWHGTVPVAGPGERLAIAFDVVPSGASDPAS